MRRYLPLLLVSFFILVIAMSSSILLSPSADQQSTENIKKIVVYTTVPMEQLSLLTQEYQRNEKIKVNLIHFSEDELRSKIAAETPNLQADLIISTQPMLEELTKRKLFTAYSSEQSDLIPGRFKDKQNLWTGLWYDPIAFAVNNDFLKTLSKNPDKWSDIIQDSKYRIGITDFMAADASANLLFTLIAANGEEQTFAYLKKLHSHVNQYARFLSTPVRMAGMGEADIGIAPQSECLRYVNDGFPISIMYPQEGTAYSLIGVGLVNKPSQGGEAKAFIEWLLKDTPQAILEQNKIYLIPTNPDTLMYRYYCTKNIKLFDVKEPFRAEQKRRFLDRWVQSVRFAPK